MIVGALLRCIRQAFSITRGSGHNSVAHEICLVVSAPDALAGPGKRRGAVDGS
jgi:hypothetical protein